MGIVAKNELDKSKKDGEKSELVCNQRIRGLNPTHKHGPILSSFKTIRKNTYIGPMALK